jgi:non-lysosomal glucosylceramidase
LHPPTPEEATRWGKAAADGQMGCLMKLYRDWQLSGDETLLLELWPKAKKALEFCWIPGGWDADQDGVMEGCQHNTMDVEYYGPNPQMGIWYLGALRAMQEIARHLGEMDFASHCNNLFENGKKWIDSHLFNGEYYEHEIRPPANAEAIAGGLRIGAGATNLDDPELQLGAGCLVDQLVGQYMAHVCGLGYMVDADHIQQTLQSLMRYNFHEDFYGHFNQMRSYVLNDEAGLVMASYPHGQRPKRPFPYYNEVMTGFEYCAGVHMLYEGEYENGLKVIQSIRNRYDGLKRSPFDEAECGHHYARAMASWAAVLALTGFHYSAVEKSMTFAPMQHAGQWFWSTGDAWGICHQNPQKSGVEINIEVKAGQISLQKLTLGGFGSLNLGHVLVLRQGDPLKGTISFY